MIHFYPNYLDNTEWKICKINLLVANKSYVKDCHGYKANFINK